MLQAGVSLFYTLKSFPQGVEKKKQNVKKFSTGGATFPPARLYIGQTGPGERSQNPKAQAGKLIQQMQKGKFNMTTMMKRCIALAMSAALALSITACGSSSKPSASQSGSASDASTVLGEDVPDPQPLEGL